MEIHLANSKAQPEKVYYHCDAAGKSSLSLQLSHVKSVYRLTGKPAIAMISAIGSD